MFGPFSVLVARQVLVTGIGFYILHFMSISHFL